LSKPSARERANRLAAQGYNCCQSTLLAFAEELGLDFEATRRLTAAFGCGVCSGNVCGAITGSAMALGEYHKGDPNAAWDDLEKIMAAFSEKYGTVLCKEICGFNPAEDYDRALREQTFFHKCRPAICDAAEFLEKLIG